MACNKKCKKPCGSPTCPANRASCPDGIQDAQCVVYHPCDTKPSLLSCINAPNGTTLERVVEMLDKAICETRLPNPGDWNLKCLESPQKPVTTYQEFAEVVADKICKIEEKQILSIDPCPPIEATIRDNKLKICVNTQQLVNVLLNNTQFTRGIVNNIVTNPELKIQFCCPFECALSVDISGLSCALCIPPTTPRIQGKLNPMIGAIETYSYSVLGGKVTGQTWEVQGGTILGASNGTTVRIQWTDSGNRWVKVNVLGCGQTVPTQAPISVQCNPTDADCGCIPISNPAISGILTPLTNSEQTYTYTGSGSSPRSFFWGVQGGSIVGRNDRSSVVIKWGSAGRGSLSLSVTGCNDLPAQLNQIITIGTTPQCEPVVLSEISGTGTPIEEQTYTYSVTPSGTIPISYAWSASAGGTILSGQSTNSVSVRWSGTGGKALSVIANNCSGANTTTKTIGVTVASATPGKECGGILEGTYGGTDNYVYPLFPLNLTQPTRLQWYTYDRPNKFDLLENGVQTLTTGWTGVADYPGPWINPINNPNTGVLMVTPTVGKRYELRVTTGPAAPTGPNQGLQDTWDVRINCPEVKIEALAPTQTPGEFTVSYDTAQGIAPYTWELRNASGTLLAGGNL